MQVTRHISLWLISLLWLSAAPQEKTDSLPVAADAGMLEEQIMLYQEELVPLAVSSNIQLRLTANGPVSDYNIRMLNERIRQNESVLSSFLFRWNTFKQVNQQEMAADETLMDLVTQVEQQLQAVSDSIRLRQQQCQSVTEFMSADRMLNSQDSIYKHYYQAALKLSMTKKTAPRLEQLKAREQILFQRLTEAHAKAKVATQLLPALEQRMAELDEKYSSLQVLSGKIQATEYKPLIQRLKDYLIGLACVAILLMFINMIVSKLQAARQARQAVKKYEEMMNQQGMGDYPTI